MPDFANRTIVVTGGCGGLGRAIASAFTDAGGRVVVADLHWEAATAFASQIGGGAIGAELDVTDEGSWIALLDRVEETFGRLDVLVNNAGIYRPNIPFEEMPIDLWRRHIAVNLDGTFLGCKHAILRMRANGEGAIVNMASGMALRANPTGAAYCASKAGVLMTTRTAAHAAGRYGIRVNVILPGPVRTEMLMGNVKSGGDEQEFLDRMMANSPLRRLATPEDIARATLFLADSANLALSGVALPVDGGNMPGG